MEIEHIKTGGSHFGLKELDHYFPCYRAVTSLVANFDQTCDCSIAWEIVVQFFQAKMWPPGFDVFYLHKYSHGVVLQTCLEWC